MLNNKFKNRVHVAIKLHPFRTEPSTGAGGVERYLEDLVGVAHGGDFVVGVGSSQLAQVADWSPAHLTVHVDLLHLVLRAHEHLEAVESIRSK